MPRNSPVLVVVVAFLLGVSNPVLGQASPSGATTAQPSIPDATYKEGWQRMVADKDFVYQPNELEKEQQNSDQKGENDRNSAMRNIIEWLTSKTGVFFLRALLVVFVACLLYLIIKNVVLPNRGRSRTKLSKANDVEGALAANNDWQTLLEKAIAARDTRMIVRYSFMGVLHLLQDNNLIAYRDDKTNYDYYQELKATDYKQPFRNLSRVYEYTWYGNYSINDNTLQQYMGIFNGLKQQLQRS